MKLAIAAVLMLTMAASPWVKEPVETPAPEPEAVVAKNTTTEPVEIPATETVVEDINVLDKYTEPVVEDECWEYSATCTITHYCNCSKCCGRWANSPTASGAWPTAGHTVAVDKKVIPMGSEVLIDGVIYVAEDTGVSGYHVDIYCDSHQEALNRGMYKAEVKWR